MEELYDKKVQCPICGNYFKTSKVKTSKLRVIKRDSDFFTYYKGENPIKYSVFVCPECGYSGMEDRFSKIKSSEKEIIKEKITSKWKKRDYSGARTVEQAIECYKLALLCGQLLDIGKFELAGICLRLGWLNRLMENYDEEIRFIKLSLELYQDAFYKENINGQGLDEISLGYLIGELHRRIGNSKEAITWFSRTISNPLIKTNPRIEKITREQWQIAKDSER